MRLLAAVLLVFVLIAAPTLAVHAGRQPFHVYQTVESERSAPWLDPSCYDDDHTLTVRAYGYLSGPWSYTSPLRVCSEKIVRAALSTDRAALTVIDYVGDVHPGRDVGRDLYACNSDNKTDQQLQIEDGDDREDGFGPVTWIVEPTKPGTYRLEMILNEPWWQGQESSYGYCGHTP